MTSTDRKWWTVLVAAAVAVVVWYALRPTIMPLDQKTLEQFQEANSVYMAKLQTQDDHRSFYEVTADGFRRAVSKVGYSADKTLLYWMSPEFRDEIAADPVSATDRMRLTDSLLRSALAEGAPIDERQRVLDGYSADVQAAARARRP